MVYRKVSISGKIASGKTTVANYLTEQFGYHQIRSAKYLKEVCASLAKINRFENRIRLAMDNIGIRAWEIQDGNPQMREETYHINMMSATMDLQNEYRHLGDIVTFISQDKDQSIQVLKRLMELREQFPDVMDTSTKTDRVRLMLQVVANVILDEIDKGIWVNSCLKDMEFIETTTDTPYFIHDDLRYPYEAGILRAQGFFIIRLDVSPEVQEARVKEIYGDIDPERLVHISETVLDDFEFDARINADQPLDSMLEEIATLIGVK